MALSSTASNSQAANTTIGKTQFRVETVASGLEVPWAFTWLPNGDMLITERKGRVRIIESGKLRTEPVFTVPDVEPSGESGLMDITLHPSFASNNFIYLAYAYNKDGKRDRVVRYTYAGGKFTDPAKYPSAEYKGKRVYFCTEACRKAFEQAPDQFMAGEIEHPE